MTGAAVSLQDLRRRIHAEAKAESVWRLKGLNVQDL